MEIIAYLFLSAMVMGIIVLFVKLLSHTLKIIVDNDDE